MEYKWNKKEILKKLKQAMEENNINNMENFRVMLDIINNTVDLHDMNTVKSDDNLTYGQHKELYIRDLQFIDEGIFDYISSIFSIEKDIDKLFTIYKHDALDLNNKELLDIGYGIIEQLNDKRVIDLYTQFRNNKTHRLNIDNMTSDKVGLTRGLQGITMYDYRNKKSYISIHREHNAEDVVTLLHEFMHAVAAMDNKYDGLKYAYFTELEGHFGERLAIEYMKKHDMKKYATQVEANDIYDLLNHSLMLYLNDLLFYTSKNSQFRYRETTKIAREETGYDDIIVRKEDIPEVCSYNGFDLVTNIIDYLIVLELNNTCDIEEQYRMIQELKKQDDFLFYNMAMPDMFNFFHDEAKDLKKLKKSIDKKTRVII